MNTSKRALYALVLAALLTLCGCASNAAIGKQADFPHPHLIHCGFLKTESLAKVGDTLYLVSSGKGVYYPGDTLYAIAPGGAPEPVCSKKDCRHDRLQPPEYPCSAVLVRS